MRAVRREREAVRGQQPAGQFDEAAPIVAIQRRAAAGLGLIDGAREESAGGINPAIVEAADRWNPQGSPRACEPFFALLVQEPDSRSQTGDESAAPMVGRHTADVFFDRIRIRALWMPA